MYFLPKRIIQHFRYFAYTKLVDNAKMYLIETFLCLKEWTITRKWFPRQNSFFKFHYQGPILFYRSKGSNAVDHSTLEEVIIVENTLRGSPEVFRRSGFYDHRLAAPFIVSSCLSPIRVIRRYVRFVETLTENSRFSCSGFRVITRVVVAGEFRWYDRIAIRYGTGVQVCCYPNLQS